MRYFVLTDIHANLEALEASIDEATRRGYDEVLVLGDLVGYGPDPNAVVDRVINLQPSAIVRGNHDKVACGLEQAEGFNSVAKKAAQWTFDVLTPDNRQWLAALPAGPQIVDDLIEICHGSPFDEDAYIFDELDAVRALRTSKRPLCLFGHTHYPITFQLAGESVDVVGAGPDASRGRMLLRDGSKYLLNPGAVGQPRDGDPRAAFGLVDTGMRSVEIVRLDYPFGETQNKVLKAGLPEVLAQRLSVGR